MEKQPALLWVSWMSRWNEPCPSHAYPSGVFSDIEAAEAEGKKEEQYRGGKYSCQHCPTYLDSTKTPRRLKLPGRKVYIASVQGFGRVHFLGVFSLKRLAKQVGAVQYPGWKVITVKATVDTPLP